MPIKNTLIVAVFEYDFLMDFHFKISTIAEVNASLWSIQNGKIENGYNLH